MASGVSSDHVTDDVTWDWTVNVVAQVHLDANIQKPLHLEARYQWDTNRKCYIASQMVTWSITSYDPVRSCSWPAICLGPIISKMAGDTDLVTIEHL